MGGSRYRSPATCWTPRQQCFASSTILVSTLSTGVIWTTPGGNSPERRLTAGISNLLLFGGRSPKPTGAGSQNTVLNGRLNSGDSSQRNQKVNQPDLRSGLRCRLLGSGGNQETGQIFDAVAAWR